MKAAEQNEVAAALSGCSSAFIGVALLSGLVNVLYLTGSFFMLEVYDRVIPSRSVPTLIGLGLLVLTLYVFQGVMENVRARILTRMGNALDEVLSPRVFDVIVRGSLHGHREGDGLLPLRDLDQLRVFLYGAGPAALLDLPWIPFYIVICSLFHPLVGLSCVIGIIVLLLLTIGTDLTTNRKLKYIVECGMRRNVLIDSSRRNAEVIAAMGMRDRFAGKWLAANDELMFCEQKVSDLSRSFAYSTKIFRAALQSGVLALGAWLVIKGEASSGVIIASSILVARALAPVETTVANWKSITQARHSWKRISETLRRVSPLPSLHGLPAPHRTLECQSVTVAPPGNEKPVVHDLTFTLGAGQGLGIIGPSASGKSSLVRALVGVWACREGKVRLDGAALDQWSSTDLGPHIGFLPQEVELFAGTIAENIARFDPAATPEDIVSAAQEAGVHDLILRLAEGYDTRLGEGGSGLSAGQRQRVGLARALYGRPFLVVLDEPNANLDHEGENALTQAIMSVRARSGLCVVVAHRPSALAALDTVMLMAEGRLQAFGPKDEVLKRVLRPAPSPQTDEPAGAGLRHVPGGAVGRQPGALTLQESA